MWQMKGGLWRLCGGGRGSGAAALRGHPLGAGAAIIGRVEAAGAQEQHVEKAWCGAQRNRARARILDMLSRANNCREFADGAWRIIHEGTRRHETHTLKGIETHETTPN
jgi:hypothetical protein